MRSLMVYFLRRPQHSIWIAIVAILIGAEIPGVCGDAVGSAAEGTVSLLAGGLIGAGLADVYRQTTGFSYEDRSFSLAIHS